MWKSKVRMRQTGRVTVQNGRRVDVRSAMAMCCQVDFLTLSGAIADECDLFLTQVVSTSELDDWLLEQTTGGWFMNQLITSYHIDWFTEGGISHFELCIPRSPIALQQRTHGFVQIRADSCTFVQICTVDLCNLSIRAGSFSQQQVSALLAQAEWKYINENILTKIIQRLLAFASVKQLVQMLMLRTMLWVQLLFQTKTLCFTSATICTFALFWEWLPFG